MILHPDFIEGQTYSRRDDIHARYGGQMQGGISTPSGFPYVFIFTGTSGEKHGYRDGWQEDENVFLYTGEGQRGDMTFVRGNRSIRDHRADGKEILLFEALGSGKPVRFIGSFDCQSWGTFRDIDTDGAQRTSIQFHLVKGASATHEAERTDLPAVNGQPSQSLAALRERALKAAVPVSTTEWRKADIAYRQRSRAIKEYVLSRANGRCELTGNPAPFETLSGSPYLEVHHTRRLSDDSPDDPRYVAAICPTVHREIHHGKNGEEINRRLIERLALIEPKAD